MRRLTARTKLALALTGATAIATAATTTAYAWDDDAVTTRTWWGHEAPTLERTAPVNAEVFAVYIDAKLDKVEAFAASLSGRAATMRYEEAKAWLAKVTWTRQALGAVDGAAFAERVAALDARLASLQSQLRTRIATLRAQLAAAREAALQAARARRAALLAAAVKADTKVLGERDHECDGFHDGWDGWSRDWSRDRWDGR